MPLQKQTVAFPLTKGIDKSRPDLLLEPDQLADGINTEILESGEITKRPGFASNVTLTRTPLAMVEGNGAQGVIYSNNYVSMPQIGAGGSTTIQDTANIGQIKPVMGNLSAKLVDLLGYNLGSIGSYDSYTNATTGEILLAFVASNTTARVYKFDKQLNVIPFLTSPYVEFSGFDVALNGIIAIKCLADRVLFYSTSTLGINMVTFTTSGVSANSLIQAVSTAGNWDACDGESGEFILAYESGGNIVTSRRSTSTGASLGTVTTSATNVVRVCVTQRIQTATAKDVCLGLLRSSGNKVSMLRYNSSLVLQQTADQGGGSDTFWAITVAATSSPSQVLVAAESGNATRTDTWERKMRFYEASGSSLNSIGRNIDRAGLLSKATQVVAGQNPIVMISHQSEDTYQLQNSYALVQFGNPADLVKSPGFHGPIAYGAAYPYHTSANSSRSNACPMVNLNILDSTKAFIPLQTRSDSSTLSTSASSIYVLRALTIEADTYYRGSRSLKIADRIFAAAGNVYNISGAGLREAGFFLYPDPIVSFTNAGAGNVADGAYQYCLVYEFIDDAGNLIESAPSQITSVTHAAGSSRQYTIVHRIPGWISYPQFRLAVYRTAASGTIFYRTAVGTYDLSVSTPTSPITITDNTSDATLVTNKLLYTTGGTVENIAPPYTQALAFVKNRLWTFEYGSTDTVWFSKEVREGFFPQFSDLLKVQLPRNYGELTGIAGIDDKVIMFKQFGVYVIVGDGPTETLVGAFSQAQPVSNGVGCINSRSIVETPQGVFFQSQEGIHILDRGMSVQFIGQPLYKTEGTIIGSTYDPVLNRIFFLSTTDLWVYYMSTGTWHRWTVTNPVDIDYLDGALYLMTTTRILKLTAGTWQDNGVNYEQRIKLGQMQLSGIQGYQRMYRALVRGRPPTSASGNITVSNFFDGNNTATDTQTIAQSATVSGDKMQIEIRPSVQKCETMQMQLSHTANNEGLTVSGLSAEIGTIGGVGRRAATGRAV